MAIVSKEKKFAPVVVTPPGRLELPDFRELWEYRGLMYFLVSRDLKVRFKQTAIGFLWIVLQPLIQMLIFSVIFGLLIRVQTSDVPYNIFFLSGFVVWQFFTQVVNSSALSLVANISIIIKSYFPRLALPLSTVLGSLVDFAVAFLLLLVFLLVNGHFPISWRYLLIPFLLALTTIFASGVGLLFGALMVVFRDMKNLLNFILMIWMYLTPIMYPLSIAPEKYRIYFYLNPLVSLVDAFRWVFLHQGDLPRFDYLLISLAVSVVIWFLGALVFRAMENTVADVM